MSGGAVIVGVGLSEHPRAPDLDGPQHQVVAMQRALEDCGLTKADIDGFMCAGGSGYDTGSGYLSDDAVNMAEYLGIQPKFIEGTLLGGSTYEFYVEHAAAAIEAGMCDHVLITYGSNLLSRFGRQLGTKAPMDLTQTIGGGSRYEVPFGSTLVGCYAMAARRHMHEFGTTSEQLAAIAVAARKYAAMNPHALYREPITIDDVVESRMVADPLHKLDCCVISDGGGAVIISRRDQAKDFKSPPIEILGAASHITHWNISQMPELTETPAALCGPRALQRAGLTPADVDALQLYDSFTITVLLMLEDLGFCKKGEGGELVSDGVLEPGGSLPLNTDGGGLSACHPGRRGIFLIIEAVRQLRGLGGEAQVHGCNVVMCCGMGGWLASASALVLGKEGAV